MKEAVALWRVVASLTMFVKSLANGCCFLNGLGLMGISAQVVGNDFGLPGYVVDSGFVATEEFLQVWLRVLDSVLVKVSSSLWLRAREM